MSTRNYCNSLHLILLQYISFISQCTNCSVMCVSIVGSVYKAGWIQYPSIWSNDMLAQDFETLREVRDVSMKSLAAARSKNYIGSSIEAKIQIQTDSAALLGLMERHLSAKSPNNYPLANFFIVSQVDTGSTRGVRVIEKGNVMCGGEPCLVSVGVAKASHSRLKCERCWQFVVAFDSEGDLCARCDSVFNS